MGLKETIIADMTAAMKAKEAEKLSVLRMIKASIMNKQIDKGSDLTDEEITKLLQTLVKQRKDSQEQYTAAGRAELAAKEQSEIGFIDVYLPKSASMDEIEAAVTAAIEETGASSIKDIGITMKAALAKLQGYTVDGKSVNELIRSRLN